MILKRCNIARTGQPVIVAVRINYSKKTAVTLGVVEPISAVSL